MFELLHDLAYDHEGRDREHYKRVAQIILKQGPPKMENRRVVEISKKTYVELRQSLALLESWTDADIHRPNCILYAGYAQPELRRHMAELVFVLKKEENMSITPEQLQNWFTYHSPNADQEQAYQDIRQAGLNLAQVIVARTPSSADQTDAIRKVREAVMTANAAVACGGQ